MTTETQETDWAEDIGQPAYESIAEMVAALEVDYDRLEELREERDGFGEDDAKRNPGELVEDYGKRRWAEENPDNAEELAELVEAAGDCENEDYARVRIGEDPLSLEVRSGWHAPGGEVEEEEFCLLLGTGGPAVRIIGDLERGEPSSARLEVQDWFKPWTEYIPADQDVLLTYCRCFYFGE